MSIIEKSLQQLDASVRDFALMALQMQGVVPYNKKDYDWYYQNGRLRRLDDFVASFKAWAEERGNRLTKQDIWRKYAPRIDTAFLSEALGVWVHNGEVKIDGLTYVYNERLNNFARFFKGDAKPYRYDYAINFLMKRCHKKPAQILTAYYKWQDNMMNKRLINKLMAKPQQKEKEVVVRRNGNIREGKISDLETFKPRVLRERAKYVRCYEKDDEGNYWHHTKEYQKHKPLELSGGAKRFALWENMSESEKKIVDEIKRYIQSRHLDTAINRPAKGWAIDIRRKAIVNYARYTLHGNTHAKSSPRISKLYRMVGNDIPKENRLRFVKGCYSIPYFLEHIKMRDKHMFVCEGCFDAAFIRNGVATCCWMPSADSQKIIDYYHEKHGFMITYVCDNFRYGDKGGIKGLTEYAAMDAYVFDWDLSDIFLLPGTDTERKINDINDLAIHLDTDEITRDFLMYHRKPAREVLADLVETWHYGEDEHLDDMILSAKTSMHFWEG